MAALTRIFEGDDIRIQDWELFQMLDSNNQD
jgi:hypothetical protein